MGRLFYGQVDHGAARSTDGAVLHSTLAGLIQRVTITAAALLVASGCHTNGFEKYYSPLPGSETTKNSPWIEHSTAEPKVYTYSEDPKSDNLRAAEDGYIMVGSSSFYGPTKNMTKAQLRDEAKRVGASLVLVHSQYKDTLSGVVPWTVQNPPQVSTFNTTGTLSAYGTGGYSTGTYSGQSTMTSPGGSTTYAIPYSVSRNDVVATFWVRQDPSKIRLGVNTVPLPEDMRTKLQRNTGVVAAAVIRGTPAFNANILRGDVILKIGGENVIDPRGFSEQLTKFEGQTVNIELLRGETTKTIAVTLHRRS